jgi:hypothetical protein
MTFAIVMKLRKDKRSGRCFDVEPFSEMWFCPVIKVKAIFFLDNYNNKVVHPVAIYV